MFAAVTRNMIKYQIKQINNSIIIETSISELSASFTTLKL